ncbi:transcriptional regulator [Reticulibacter mediterranei]|uniref:Transcriptional regulator n=1 Tax=Reticulibacter mediterranei TaxID=2778369 RepID=A0A8J3IR03_9CHLR|nr:helix-turn-helix transcriptional regulator [Reticulibacter mediterranei]GHO99161.1 transcriptional regulator [Reticulibacter mediterranei]
MLSDQRVDDAQRRTALGEFLRTRRARLTPTQIGLPAGPRRRTPGLRREEVAVAAGVSTTWYTYLEQGRDIHVSRIVLECIADALHLNQDERLHLFLLADQSTTATPSLLPEETIPAAYQLVLDGLTEYPAYIRGRRMDILAWNKAACAVFGDFALLPHRERNFLWLIFTDTPFRRLFVDHAGLAQEMLEIFRETATRYMSASWLHEFTDALSQASPEFRQHWQGHNVRRKSYGAVSRELLHPEMGRLVFTIAGFQMSGDPDIQCCIFTSTPNSETATKLRQQLHSPAPL